MTLSLYAHPFSSYCQKVQIAFYENATPFTYRLLGPEDPAAMEERQALWPLGRFPVVVDDGGHTMMQQQNTLGAYWPHVNPGGAFVMEDLHTSVLEKFQTPQWQNEGYGKTVDVLFDSPPPGLERMECNFKRDQIPKNDLQSQKNDNFGMTCILHKAK